ncbi:MULTISPECIES: DUF5107 domain-containing protein [unclassified Isoptericola]|uniref:DUF5107 domain-containing protein n=1 Tax=unclassified Isoptericola TaxID=2623355 RepID=UPI003649C436
MSSLSASTARIVLPPVPAALQDREVAVWSEPVEIATYLPEPPDSFPAFLDRRVYQGSSGRVFPLSFHERISPERRPRLWQAIHLENEWLRLMILPELGGRIHVAYDKRAGYDIFYRNNVIKPALVGLAGPWISGGVEFNWPQHHRPATFLPVDVEIEETDETATVWCSDHDPFARMKGMHGVRLSADSSRIDLLVRLYNRSEVRQTFLWWANVAARVDGDYQAFFPRDVRHVADHARRAVTSFPAADRPYYGVDYPARGAAVEGSDRLDWYHHIPVPTSYMVTESSEEFFGGYDHGRDAGFVHWAPREVSPGKKMWTWGNAPFGQAWDRNLTDDDGPYIELMAGVYTDNQPDFAWIAPGEAKEFAQCWYPIRGIGPATSASRSASASVHRDGDLVRIGLVASTRLSPAVVRVLADGAQVLREDVDLQPDEPWWCTVVSAVPVEVLLDKDGTVVLTAPELEPDPSPPPRAAVAPPRPADVATIDELHQIAVYLRQYRHATRRPEPYWEEMLRRDPGETRAATALGAAAHAEGRYGEAESLLRGAVDRLTAWAQTPASGEAHYLLGLVLLRLGRDTEARTLLARAAWDAAWELPAGFALARSLTSVDRSRAIEHLVALTRRHPDHAQASCLLAALLADAGRAQEARSVASGVLERDPLDQWARDLLGLPPSNDPTIVLDVALEYAAARLDGEVLRVLDVVVASPATALGQVNVVPLAHYHRAVVLERLGRADDGAAARAAARASDPRWCAASRLDDVAALEAARGADPRDALAALLHGNWLYDRGRHAEAVNAWTAVVRAGSDAWTAAVAHRNLGIAAYNVQSDRSAAERSFTEARSLAPDSAKLLYEWDQLRIRLGHTPDARLVELDAEPALVSQRDDLTVARAEALLAVGRVTEARESLAGREFQPWEGGEGKVLAAWDGVALATARAALAHGRPADAVAAMRSALQPPTTLGEARHPLANDSELRVVLGDALAASGRPAEAATEWEHAAAFTGDFARMSPQPYSASTIWSILALRRLGRVEDAAQVENALRRWVEEQAGVPATIDYFATSLPTMLLFVDDPQVERDQEVAAIRSKLTLLEGSPVPGRRGPAAAGEA